MSAKINSQQQSTGGRRPPLSLSSGGSGGGTGTGSVSGGGGASKNQNSLEDIKKQQVNYAYKPDDKKSQNGTGKNNGNSKDKVQNGGNSNNGNAIGDATDNNKETSQKNERTTFKDEKKDSTCVPKHEKRAERNVNENFSEQEKKLERVQKDTSEEAKKDTDSGKDRKIGKDTEKIVLDKAQNKEIADADVDVEKEIKRNETDMEKKQSSDENPKKSVDVVSSKSYIATEKKNATPTTRKSSRPKLNRDTPTKGLEKFSAVITSIAKKEKPDPIREDVDMEPLIAGESPIKSSLGGKSLGNEVATIIPAATSTPGKQLFNYTSKSKQDVQLATESAISTPDRNNCPRSYSQISGRRSIRPTSDCTPSKFQSNTQFRESYRRINTELDVTSNTSLNVTVGSEIPNNSSFSFFGRSRKRDRTPPGSQSAMELQSDGELPSPTKRARLDMYGFLSVVASPLTALRARFSKASIQSSTPVKLNLEESTDEGEVQNVSGIDDEEKDIPKLDGEELTPTGEVTVANEAGLATLQKKDSPAVKSNDDLASAEKIANTDKSTQSDDEVDAENPDCGLQITEPLNSGPVAKNKRCNIM